MYEHLVGIFPHSDDEFKAPENLTSYLSTTLPIDMDGEYLLGKMGRKDKNFAERMTIGCLILFRKGRLIVGEAIIQKPISQLRPPVEDKTERGIGKLYYNHLFFDTKTIKIYKPPLLASELEDWSGKLDPRYYKILGLLKNYRARFKV